MTVRAWGTRITRISPIAPIAPRGAKSRNGTSPDDPFFVKGPSHLLSPEPDHRREGSAELCQCRLESAPTLLTSDVVLIRLRRR